MYYSLQRYIYFLYNGLSEPFVKESKLVRGCPADHKVVGQRKEILCRVQLNELIRLTIAHKVKKEIRRAC